MRQSVRELVNFNDNPNTPGAGGCSNKISSRPLWGGLWVSCPLGQFLFLQIGRVKGQVGETSGQESDDSWPEWPFNYTKGLRPPYTF